MIPSTRFRLKKFHCVPLQFLIGTAVTDNGSVSVASQHILHSCDDLRTKGIIKLRDHYPDGLGGIGLQASCHLIDLIVQFLDGFLDLYSVFFSYVSAIKIRRIVASPSPVRLAISFMVAAILITPFLLFTEIPYSAFPSQPQTFIRASTSSFTAWMAFFPYAFGSMVFSFSANVSFTALEYAARSSVAKFTLQIPRFTQSLTSSSLSPDAP